jgi:hypothetical protein
MWPDRWGRERQEQGDRGQTGQGQIDMTYVHLIETDHNVAGQVGDRETGARGQRTGRTWTGKDRQICTFCTPH